MIAEIQLLEKEFDNENNICMVLFNPNSLYTIQYSGVYLELNMVCRFCEHLIRSAESSDRKLVLKCFLGKNIDKIIMDRIGCCDYTSRKDYAENEVKK